MLKYLAGSMRVKQTNADNVAKLIDSHAIVLTVKRDIYQHSDMRSDVRIEAGNGGFVIDYGTKEGMTYMGESLSCRINTGNAGENLTKLTQEYNWWAATKFDLDNYIEYQLWLLLPSEVEPSEDIGMLIWEKSSYEDFLQYVGK